MREMQNIEYFYIVRELSQLENKHFSKIYSLGEKSFRMKIGNDNIIIELPIRLGIAKYLEKSETSAFTEKIRKILNNQKLLKISQYGNDRILEFDFEKNILFLEMFAKGNFILTNNDRKIAAVFREEMWKDRILKNGAVYNAPKNEITENFEKTLSEKYIIVCLLKLPLGKEYVKEMLAKCRIDEKKPGNALNESEILSLKNEYEKILQNLKPYLFLENGKIVDYGLTKFKKYENLETKEMLSLSEAMEEFYAFASKEKKSEKIEALERRLNEQNAMLEKLKQEESEAKEKGDFIYMNYEKIEKILQSAKEIGIQNIDKLNNVLKIDKRKKEIELETENKN